ncbi:MAG TPA: hypothetical protein VFX92_03065 [Candidatus Krumholzibacteria bacterium]|nr:hypothetical protein [Candidatus Krumholzibacteria bacterium]
MIPRFPTIPALVATAVLVFAGCNSDEQVSGTGNPINDSVALASVIPSLADIRGAVTMDDADAAVVQKALDEWKQTVKSDKQQGPFAMHRGGMQFVAAVAPSFDNGQLSDLANYMISLREQHRAQAGQHGMFRGDGKEGKRFEQMIKDLGLTAEQQKQMRALHTEMQAQMKQMHEAFRAGSMTEDDFRAAMDAFHDAQREKLAAILTPDQLKKHDELRDQRRDRMMDRRMDRIDDGVDTRLAWLTAVLGLDDAQQAQVRSALETAAQARKTAMESRQAGEATRESMRTQMRELRDTTHEAINAVLTEQQQERLQIMESLRSGPGPHHP